MINTKKRKQKKFSSLTNCITNIEFGDSANFHPEEDKVTLKFPALGHESELNKHLCEALKQEVLSLETKIYSHKTKKDIKAIKGVKNIIAVASGKGGVGKSTVTVMLAKGLQQLGASVAILDADIYGPSMPKMLGDHGGPSSPDNKSFVPVNANGIQSMSLGYMIEEDSPAIWRGSMITKALMQMIEETRWKEVDYLLIDLPPGTGDIQLTMIQKIPVTATVIVTTPQDISLIDAQKALKMFQKVDIPILGIIENMSLFHCPNCGHEEHIFGQGAASKMQEKFNTQILGQLPLNIDIRKSMDKGQPDSIWYANEEMKKKAEIMAMKASQTLAKLPINVNFDNPLKLHTL